MGDLAFSGKMHAGNIYKAAKWLRLPAYHGPRTCSLSITEGKRFTAGHTIGAAQMTYPLAHTLTCSRNICTLIRPLPMEAMPLTEGGTAPYLTRSSDPNSQLNWG